jgi:hypothetical protein
MEWGDEEALGRLGGWFAAKPNGVPTAKIAARMAWSKAGRRELLLAY